MHATEWLLVCRCAVAVWAKVSTKAIQRDRQRRAIRGAIPGHPTCNSIYLDDSIILRLAGTSQCKKNLGTLVNVCQCLGIHLAEEKLEGPATRLEILGIIVYSETRQLSLPEQKLEEVLALLQE